MPQTIGTAEETADFLAPFPPFDQLQREDLLRLAASVTVRAYPAGTDILIEDGPPAPALADYGKEPTMRRHQAAVSTYERHAEMRMRGMPDLQRANDPYWSPCDYNSNTPIINSCF